MDVLLLVAAVAAAACLWLAARAAITVCVLDVRAGKVGVRRGVIAPRVLAAIADVVEKPAVSRATLRIVRDRGYARLEIRGEVSAVHAQRLRNVVGSVPLAQLANGGRRPSA